MSRLPDTHYTCPTLILQHPRNTTRHAADHVLNTHTIHKPSHTPLSTHTLSTHTHQAYTHYAHTHTHVPPTPPVTLTRSLPTRSPPRAPSTADGSLYIWDLQLRRPAAVFPNAHAASLGTFGLAPLPGGHFVSLGRDASLALWQLTSSAAPSTDDAGAIFVTRCNATVPFARLPSAPPLPITSLPKPPLHHHHSFTFPRGHCRHSPPPLPITSFSQNPETHDAPHLLSLVTTAVTLPPLPITALS